MVCVRLAELQKMIYSTKGIVLRTVKYGETSVIAAIFTEVFGIQSYIVNGVRTAGRTSKNDLFYKRYCSSHRKIWRNIGNCCNFYRGVWHSVVHCKWCAYGWQNFKK